MNDLKKILDLELNSALEKRPDLMLKQARLDRIFNLANDIREFRKRRGITQAQLAGMIGKTQPFVARLENPNSDREPNIATLDRIAQALNLVVSVKIQEQEVAH